jgi:enoyl-CoA hydratase
MIDLLIEDRTAVLTINRLNRSNALDGAHWESLRAHLVDIADMSLHGLIITGAGDRVFAAGADIGELAARQPIDALLGISQRVVARIEDLPFPSIAAINGHALGGGCEIALACDMRLAVAHARIGLPEVGLGIIPGAGGTQRLPRIVGYSKALEMILTGEPVEGDEALRIGLVNRLCAPEELMATAHRLVSRISQQGALAVSVVRSVLQAGGRAGERDPGFLLERLASVAVYTSDDRAERMHNFLEKTKREKNAHE